MDSIAKPNDESGRLADEASLHRCVTPTEEMRAKRILLVSNRVMHYRVPVYNYFWRRFQDYGCDFQVLADTLQKQNQHRIEFGFREMPFNFSSYARAIRATKPDVVILFLLLKDLITLPLEHWLKLKGIPFIIWTKGGNWDRKESWIRYQWFNYVHGLADGLILYSQACRRLIKPQFQAKCFVANNTLNFHSFPLVEASREEIKREFNIPFQKVVLFVGRMGAGKGRKRVDRLVDIFNSLTRPDIGLVLVGSGMPEELRRRLNPKNTIYLGEVYDPKDLKIAKLFKMADICAIPGHVGLGINQAFYWGLPVVAEEGDHPPEAAYLKDGRNGFMVPADQPEAFRDKLLFLLDNDEVRREFSNNAMEVVQKEASIEGMFRGFRDCVNYATRREQAEALAA